MNLKKIKIIIICLIGSLPSLLFSQNYSKNNSDLNIIEFINMTKNHLGNDLLDNTILSWDSCEIYGGNNCFYGEFIQNKTDLIVTENILKLIQIEFNSVIHSTKVFTELKNLKSNNFYYNISVPLIIERKNIAFVKFSYWCGEECGSGGILIFKYEKGKWKKIDSRCNWVS